jgi:hypothetical protein
VDGAVRAYLQADAIHDYFTMSTGSTGTIRDEWLWFDEEYGRCNCPPDVLTIERLRVASIKRDHAAVDLLAHLHASDHVTTISGPMTLVKGASGWLIQDYRRNGNPFARSIVPLRGVASKAGIEVKALGIVYDQGAGAFFFEVGNGRGA